MKKRKMSKRIRRLEKNLRKLQEALDSEEQHISWVDVAEAYEKTPDHPPLIDFYDYKGDK